jgi:hypothetical protein
MRRFFLSPLLFLALCEGDALPDQPTVASDIASPALEFPRVKATIVRGITNPELPKSALIALQLENVSANSYADILSAGFTGKSAGPEVFEPIWVRWRRGGKVAVKEGAALQRSMTLGPRQMVQIFILVSLPPDGDYVLEITRKPLIGTGNFVSPAGFAASRQTKVKSGVLHFKDGDSRETKQ